MNRQPVHLIPEHFLTMLSKVFSVNLVEMSDNDILSLKGLLDLFQSQFRMAMNNLTIS